jgi:hypothetical protein
MTTEVTVHALRAVQSGERLPGPRDLPAIFDEIAPVHPDDMNQWVTLWLTVVGQELNRRHN